MTPPHPCAAQVRVAIDKDQIPPEFRRTFTEETGTGRKSSVRADEDVDNLRQSIADHLDSGSVQMHSTIARHVNSSSRIDDANGKIPRLARVSDPQVTVDLVRRKSSIGHADDESDSLSGKFSSRKPSITVEDVSYTNSGSL